MKKIIFILLVLALSSSGVYAAPGDVVGEIYSTDILAYVGGRQINSYNIGGKTVVLAEELCDNNTGTNYGFTCEYDNDSRTLTLTSTFTEGNVSPKISRGTVGEVLGNVYETDIKVIFNSHEIMGYNIGGQTAICIEDLGAYYEGEHNAQYGYSKYLCNAVWNGETREISLNTFLQDSNYFGKYSTKKLFFLLNDNQLSCTFDQLNPFNSILVVNFSDEFKNSIYQICPVIINGTTVGQMIMKPDGVAAFRINDQAIHAQTDGLALVLSYDDAKKYVAASFKIITQKEDENATIFLAQKDGEHYLLFAMKNGGLVCESKYDSSYTTVKLDTKENGEHYLFIENNSFSGSMTISTVGYDFN